MEFRMPKNHQMGRPKPDLRCKKHLKHQQSPGVCSMCLRERLSQLSTSSRCTIATTMASSCSSSSLSSLSSSNASSYSSPMHHNHHFTLESKGSISFLRSGNHVLPKSRSMAFVSRIKEREAADHGKKKGGFWSKLLRPRSKRMDEGLMHSRTMRERVTDRVH